MEEGRYEFKILYFLHTQYFKYGSGYDLMRSEHRLKVPQGLRAWSPLVFRDEASEKKAAKGTEKEYPGRHVGREKREEEINR